MPPQKLSDSTLARRVCEVWQAHQTAANENVQDPSRTTPQCVCSRGKYTWHSLWGRINWELVWLSHIQHTRAPSPESLKWGLRRHTIALSTNGIHRSIWSIIVHSWTKFRGRMWWIQRLTYHFVEFLHDRDENNYRCYHEYTAAMKWWIDLLGIRTQHATIESARHSRYRTPVNDILWLAKYSTWMSLASQSPRTCSSW
jgi:hypothetical protein